MALPTLKTCCRQSDPWADELVREAIARACRATLRSPPGLLPFKLPGFALVD